MISPRGEAAAEAERGSPDPQQMRMARRLEQVRTCSTWGRAAAGDSRAPLRLRLLGWVTGGSRFWSPVIIVRCAIHGHLLKNRLVRTPSFKNLPVHLPNIGCRPQTTDY
jgi:hypothetical protein